MTFAGSFIGMGEFFQKFRVCFRFRLEPELGKHLIKVGIDLPGLEFCRVFKTFTDFLIQAAVGFIVADYTDQCHRNQGKQQKADRQRPAKTSGQLGLDLLFFRNPASIAKSIIFRKLSFD